MARQAGPCDPQWLVGDAIQGVSGAVNALCSMDFDGPGPARVEVFAGGKFSVAGGELASNIARWDGVAWRALGTGVDGTVRALAAYDADNDGPRPPVLVAGGEFLSAGGVPVNWIAQWDGAEWLPVGGGISGAGANARVEALASFDPDGGGPAIPELIAAGAFNSAGGVVVNNIARWDGEGWKPLASGVSGTVFALTVFQPAGGAGPSLIAAGGFGAAGGFPASRIAAWDGVSWTPLGSGLNNSVFAVHAFHPPGGAARLIAGGQFSAAGGSPARGIAAWNGSGWSAMGSGLGSSVLSVRSGDPDGAGPEAVTLFAAGSFATTGTPVVRNVARWDGVSWQPLGGSTSSSVNALDVPGDGTGLVAAGAFAGVEGRSVGGIAVWNGSGWGPFGTGTDDQVNAAEVFDPDGAGPLPAQLVIGGEFTTIGGTAANRLAIGDGLSWRAIGSGADGPVTALCRWDPDGDGPRGPLLAVGGDFTSIDGHPFDDIALWDGQSFTAEPIHGFNYSGVSALTTYDFDGPGGNPAYLVALGAFELGAPNGGILRHIAFWNGALWLPIGSGEMTEYAFAAASFDFDGAGAERPALVVGGSFPNLDHSFHNHVAAWTGSQWRSLGQGLGTNVSQWVLTLAAFDPDGAGPAPERLFAGGTFTATGAGVPAKHIAFFDGTEWRPMGSGADNFVTRLVPFRLDPAEPLRLLALGTFSSMDGVPAAGAAVWDGVSWTALGSGLGSGVSASQPTVPGGALVFRPDGAASDRLFVFGNHTRAGGLVAASISQWGHDTALWRSPVSGGFDDGPAWSCGAPPQTLERARFDGAEAGYGSASYSVSLGGGRSESVVRSVDVVTDRVTLVLSDERLIVTGDSPTVSRSGLQVVGGASDAPKLTIVGEGGTGSEVAARGLSIGSGAGATVEIEGAALRVSGAAAVGAGSDVARLSVGASGWCVIEGALTVGAEVGGFGEVSVAGSGAVLRLAQSGGTVDIGLRGAAAVQVGGAAAVGGAVVGETTLDTVSVASYAGASATVSVFGPGAAWATSQQRLFIGQLGSASFDVGGGATVTTQSSERLVVGRFSDGAGVLTVRGAGSRWHETGAVFEVGAGGTLCVSEGAAVEAVGFTLHPGALLCGDAVVRCTAPLGAVGQAGRLVNGGVIEPGVDDAFGVLAIEGDLVSTLESGSGASAGVVAVDAGTGPVADRVWVSGHAALAGTLRVGLRAGFDPPAGTRFTVLTAQGGISGRFEVATFPGLVGRFFRLEYVQSGAGGPARVDVVIEAQVSAGFRTSSFTSAGVPSAALAADVNSDGFPDLLLALPDSVSPESQPGQVAVLLNGGAAGSVWNGFVSQQISVTTGRAPAALAAARFRGAGAPVDLAVACAGDDRVRFHSNGGGAVPSFVSFIDVPSGGLRPVALRAADLDGDSDVDVALVNFGDVDPPPEIQTPDRGNARVLINGGTGAMSLGPALPTGWYPLAIALLDFNRDGLPDIVTADSGTNEVSTFASGPPQGGAPSFRAPVRYRVQDQPIDVEPGGLDNPKEPNDFAAITRGNPGAGQTGSMLVFLNAGAAAPASVPFQSPAVIPLPGEPLDLAALDLDDDVDTDLAVTLLSSPGTGPRARVLRNNSGPSPTGGLVLTLEPQPVSVSAAALVLASDVDSDGRDDLLLIGPEMSATAAGGAGRSLVSVARGASPCRGDLDGDDAVSGSDLAALLGVFGRLASESPEARGADLNADGRVDTVDLIRMLGAFGSVCG